jgi:hypothetical protein
MRGMEERNAKMEEEEKMKGKEREREWMEKKKRFEAEEGTCCNGNEEWGADGQYCARSGSL